MPKLTWEKRDYEIGIDRGVFYPAVGSGEAWSGLISVNEAIDDVTANAIYVDGVKVSNSKSPGSFSASISSYKLPSSFLANPRKPFGLSYRVQTENKYKIHLVYNALAQITNTKYTQNEPTPLGFDISTRPIAIPDAKSAAHLIIDADAAWPEALAAFEAVLYGDADHDARLPLPAEIYSLFDLNALFRIIDNGDGTYTMDGPDWAFEWVNATTVTVDWPKIIYVDEQTYNISSW